MNESEIEQRVEAMTAEGLRITREAIEQYKPVAIMAAYSSGDDSIVSTHFGVENFSALVINAGTKIALSKSVCHLKAVCEKRKWTLQIEEATPEGPPRTMLVRGKKVPFDQAVLPAGKWLDGATAYEEYCLNFGFPGRGKPQHARMYQRLKERPFRRILAQHGAAKAESRPKVLILSGIRGDESAIRAGYKRPSAPGNFGDVWVNPFYYRTASDFEAYRQEFGLPRNPVKAQCGISGECCCLTFGQVGERDIYRVIEPTFAEYTDDLERRVKANGFPWGYGESPPAEWAAAERIVRDAKRGQGFLFDADERVSIFQPMCVGCKNGRR